MAQNFLHVDKKQHQLLLLEIMKKILNCKHFREKIEKVQSKMWILDIDDQGLYAVFGLFIMH